MPKIKVKGQTVQAERPQTNERTHTHGRYQTYYVLCYAVAKNVKLISQPFFFNKTTHRLYISHQYIHHQTLLFTYNKLTIEYYRRLFSVYIKPSSATIHAPDYDI